MELPTCKTPLPERACTPGLPLTGSNYLGQVSRSHRGIVPAHVSRQMPRAATPQRPEIMAARVMPIDLSIFYAETTLINNVISISRHRAQNLLHSNLAIQGHLRLSKIQVRARERFTGFSNVVITMSCLPTLMIRSKMTTHAVDIFFLKKCNQ